MCLVGSDICEFCVIVGFKNSSTKGNFKELADRKHREHIRLLYDVLKVQIADFTNRWHE